MKIFNKLYQHEATYIMPTYGRNRIILEKGRGAYLYDVAGKKYLDFIGGLATCPLGHSNPKVSSTIKKQATKLLNVTNLFYTQPQIALAKRLVGIAGFKGKVFFSNSGAEAVETAIKLARKYTKKKEIIATEKCFHGRTFGALSATWKAKFRKPFMPLVPNFKHIKYNSPAHLEKAITNKTAAFIVEPIQGEAGVVIPARGYLKEIRKICSKHGILLIIDEIQTGMGRTGTFFAYEQENIKPDVITVAKGLANGIPIGATIAKSKISNTFERGDHGSTFGGNSFSTAVANEVVDLILKKRLSNNAKIIGDYFLNELVKLKEKHSVIKEIRGKGLMIAIDLDSKAKDIVAKCMKYRLLSNYAAKNTLRFLPPLIITKREVNMCLYILDKVLGESSREKT
jgi:predicted acetylornithine/succinylornithine family transaminase